MKNTFLIISLLISSLVFSQDNNLVPNGSFDEIEKKIKEGQMIELATGWTSIGEPKADLYTKEAKSEDFMTKTNKRGGQEAEDGDSYAGIVAYSYRNASPRSYLQAKLTSKLEAGKDYCVKFHVSFADLSKYAVNNLGLFLSEKPITTAELNNHRVEPQIMHSRNRIFEEYALFESICQTYTAKGNEEYLSIGNFAHQDSTKYKKIRKPRGVMGVQTMDAYYFIESVSVIPLNEVRSCVCEREVKEQEIAVVYKKTVSGASDADKKNMVEETVLYFDIRKPILSPENKKKINNLALFLKAHTDYKVEVQGHADKMEVGTKGADPLLSKKRAKAAYDYLVLKGIKREQLTYVGLNATKPKSTDQSTSGRAQNRRVVFVVK